MPDITGSELSIEDPPSAADDGVLLMSAFVNDEITACANEAGIPDALAKPLASRDSGRVASRGRTPAAQAALGARARSHSDIVASQSRR